MKDYINKFLRYLEIERAASPDTVRAYKSDLEEFFKHVHTEPDKIDLIDVRGFIAEQRGLPFMYLTGGCFFLLSAAVAARSLLK